MIGGFIGSPIGGVVNLPNGNVTMTVTSGTYSLAGQSALFRATAGVTAGSYTISGQNIVFRATILAATGAYALTGQSALFAAALPAASGAYAITGQAALITGRMPAAAGAYNITGQSAVLTDGLIPVPGVYALTGQAALFVERTPVSSGSYAITGQAAALTPTTDALSGAYALAGSSVTFHLTMPCASGVYTISGSPAPYFETIRGAGGDKKPYRGRLEIARRKIIITDDEGRTRRVDLLRHLKPPPPFAPAPDWVLRHVPDVPTPADEALSLPLALPTELFAHDLIRKPVPTFRDHARLPESLVALQDARDENDLVELLTNSPDPLVEDIRQVLSLLHASGELERLVENA